jgi:LETM1 and EF-hand domain-containing protein 1, mitochondrial
MSLWLPRTSQVVLSRSYSRIRVRSSLPLALHPRFQSSRSTNATSSPKPSPPTLKDATQASLMTRAWKKVKHEAAHYWSGTKLLVSEVRISSRLQWKILQGEALTRRERRQVFSFQNYLQKRLCSTFAPS